MPREKLTRDEIPAGHYVEFQAPDGMHQFANRYLMAFVVTSFNPTHTAETDGDDEETHARQYHEGRVDVEIKKFVGLDWIDERMIKVADWESRDLSLDAKAVEAGHGVVRLKTLVSIRANYLGLQVPEKEVPEFIL